MGFFNDMKGALGIGNTPSNSASGTTTVPPMPPANTKPANTKPANNKPTLMSSTLSTNSGMNSLKGGRRRRSSRKTKKRSKRSKTSRRRN